MHEENLFKLPSGTWFSLCELKHAHSFDQLVTAGKYQFVDASIATYVMPTGRSMYRSEELVRVPAFEQGIDVLGQLHKMAEIGLLHQSAWELLTLGATLPSGKEGGVAVALGPEPIGTLEGRLHCLGILFTKSGRELRRYTLDVEKRLSTETTYFLSAFKRKS
ncbi:MAG: hypothetical protein ABIP96_00805 [Patescibacteria group bacterium]